MVRPKERFRVVDGERGEHAAAVEHRRRNRRNTRLRRFNHGPVEVDDRVHGLTKWIGPI